MRYSNVFAKTTKEVPADADSPNAKFLQQGGFVNQLAAGIYTYLPFGLRVLEKVKKIVREEMNAIGGQEVLMPALHPKENYIKTDRWDKMEDVLFKLKGSGDKEYTLSSTGEEIVTPLVKEYVKSYKDLPLAVYQIQDKFRNEARAKSGLLRGREFAMKDLYSFHLTEEDFWDYYEKSKLAYLRVFQRCGLDAIVVNADGGVFSKYSHEFQVFTESGEDLVFYCDACGEAWNKELKDTDDALILEEGTECKLGDDCKGKSGKDEVGVIKTGKAIEVGNIFPLKTRFTEAFDFKVAGPSGEMIEIIMGCYGIGPSRVMGSIVDVHHDDKGIIWPKEVAPFSVHIISLSSKDDAMNDRIKQVASSLHDDLEKSGVEVLWDDRSDESAGAKFADADLIGIPLRLVVSERNLKDDAIEMKGRTESDSRIVSLGTIMEEIEKISKKI